MLIRPPQKADAHSMSRIYVQTWQDTYLGLVSFGYLYKMSVPRLEQEFLKELNSNRVISYVAEDALPLVAFQYIQSVNFTIIDMVTMPFETTTDKSNHPAGIFGNITDDLVALQFIQKFLFKLGKRHRI